MFTYIRKHTCTGIRTFITRTIHIHTYTHIHEKFTCIQKQQCGTCITYLYVHTYIHTYIHTCQCNLHINKKNNLSRVCISIHGNRSGQRSGQIIKICLSQQPAQLRLRIKLLTIYQNGVHPAYVVPVACKRVP